LFWLLFSLRLPMSFSEVILLLNILSAISIKCGSKPSQS
jgi:hypothetical protein